MNAVSAIAAERHKKNKVHEKKYIYAIPTTASATMGHISNFRYVMTNILIFCWILSMNMCLFEIPSYKGNLTNCNSGDKNKLVRFCSAS